MKQNQNNGIDYSSYQGITYEDFRLRALDPNFSQNEKIGFPDSYREGFEEAIFGNILCHLPAIIQEQQTILDIGCGCGSLAARIIAMSEVHDNTLLMADSDEMLALLPESSIVRKISGLFPENVAMFEPYVGKVNAILVYSVAQHIVLKHSIQSFLDNALSLLASGGTLLLGDIPNTCKRDRFFASDAGLAAHRSFTGTDSRPPFAPYTLKPLSIDDGTIFGILQRYRNAGFESYLVPQPRTLPQWNRREDIVIKRW